MKVYEVLCSLLLGLLFDKFFFKYFSVLGIVIGRIGIMLF